MKQQKIKIGILGYGNIGRGVEIALRNSEDMELVGIFTRRDPLIIKSVYCKNIYSVNELEKWQDKIDVLILCGGSATDLPIQGPKYIKMFNTVDSFDTHSNIPKYYAEMNEKALANEKVGIISIGWDPGLFSLNRLLDNAFLSNGKTYTFWGEGVSQGHSDAIRRIEGVVDAVQFTIPVVESVEKVRSGTNPDLTTREKHTRECYVAVKDGYDKGIIEKEIKEMPSYFAEYDTFVHFVSLEEVKEKRGAMPHGGFVIHSAKTGINNEHKQLMEFSLNLDSNPEFTASIMVAFARAAYRLALKKDYGAKTIFDIPLKLLVAKSEEEVIKELL